MKNKSRYVYVTAFFVIFETMKNQKELNELIKKYPGLCELYIPEVDETLYLRPIDRMTYTAAMKFIRGGDELSGAEVILKSCTVLGDFSKVCKDLTALRETSVPLNEFIEVKSGVLKKNLTVTE